jgi:hypothetical protein
MLSFTCPETDLRPLRAHLFVLRAHLIWARRNIEPINTTWAHWIIELRPIYGLFPYVSFVGLLLSLWFFFERTLLSPAEKLLTCVVLSRFPRFEQLRSDRCVAGWYINRCKTLLSFDVGLFPWLAGFNEHGRACWLLCWTLAQARAWPRQTPMRIGPALLLSQLDRLPICSYLIWTVLLLVASLMDPSLL